MTPRGATADAARTPSPPPPPPPPPAEPPRPDPVLSIGEEVVVVYNASGTVTYNAIVVGARPSETEPGKMEYEVKCVRAR